MVLTLIVMNAFYTAKLASFLTVENKVSAVESIKNLINLPPGINYGAKSSGSTIQFFAESNNTDYNNMYDKMMREKHLLPNTTQEGIDLAVGKNYAFIMESSTIEYTIERICDVVQVGKPLDEKGYGIAMKKSILIFVIFN